MRLTSSQIDAIKQTAAEVYGIKRRTSLFNHFGVSYATVSWAVKPADKEGVRMSNVRPDAMLLRAAQLTW